MKTPIAFVASSLLVAANLVNAQEPPAPVPAPPKPPEAAAPSYDFGDFGSSTLATKAWAALQAKDNAAVDAYTGKCIELYLAEALKMQAALTAPAPKESANSQWALNDVGTCLFIRGQAREAAGNKKGALEDFKQLTEKLKFAQCWDTNGWFWSPADAAAARVKALEFDAQP